MNTRRRSWKEDGIEEGRGEAPGGFGPPSAPWTAPGLPPWPAQGLPGVTHQLLTCRIVSPVSCASCFFCSSEGYGCCDHHQRVTLPAQLPSDLQGLAPWGW